MAGGRIKGITVVIGGDTTGLDKALKGIDKELSETQRSLKDVNRLLKLDPKNTQLLEQKQRLLKEAIQETEKRLETLKNADKQAKRQLDSGDLGRDKYDALQREIIDTENKLKSLNNEFKGMKFKNFSDGMSNIASKAKAASDAIQPLSTAATGLLAALAATVPATQELRTDLSRLENNAKSAGVGIEETNEAFDKFVVITDEVDSSVEAISNLLQAGFKESNLQKAVEGLAGAFLKFPDTLKIESLADSLQETLATGKAVGQYAELLERLGINLEEFDAGLSQITDEAERQNYVLDILAREGLIDVYNGYVQNNEALIESKKATQDFQEALAELAEIITPIITKITEVATQIIEWFTKLSPEIQNTILAVLALVAALGPALSIIGSIATVLSVLGASFLGVAAIVAAVVVAIVGGLIYLYTNFESVREKINQIVENIKLFFDGLGKKTEEVFLWMLTSISTAIQNIVIFVTDFVRVIGEWFENLKNTIKNKTDEAKTNAVNAFENMVNGIKNTVSGIYGIITGGFEGAISYIKSLPGMAYQWGVDFVEGLKRGIRERIDQVVNSVAEIAEKIRSLIHFSRPDTGPLRDYEKWMPDFMQGLADGIYKNIPIVTKAMNSVAENMEYSILKETTSQSVDPEKIYGAVRSGTIDGSPRYVLIDERSFRRGLGEMGVVMN